MSQWKATLKRWKEREEYWDSKNKDVIKKYSSKGASGIVTSIEIQHVSCMFSKDYLGYCRTDKPWVLNELREIATGVVVEAEEEMDYGAATGVDELINPVVVPVKYCDCFLPVSLI